MNLQNFKKTLAMMLGFFAFNLTAHAAYSEYETVSIPANFTVSPASTKSIQLNDVRRVRNIVVQAEGINTDSTIEVMVNGQIKGTIHAPGRDPSYVVTIEETTRSIEFRHRDGGNMRILNVAVTQSTWSKPNYGSGRSFYGDKQLVQQLASRILAQVEYLNTLSTPDEINDYLFPIKKNAALVYVMSNAHGALSKSTIDQLVALIDQIDFAQNFLATMMKKDVAFDSAVEILTIRETIVDLID